VNARVFEGAAACDSTSADLRGYASGDSKGKKRSAYDDASRIRI
jgi:hypothetical protein